MKRIIASCWFLMGIFLISFADIKMETLGWFDYSVTTDTNADNGCIDKGGAFYISRLYVTMMGDVGKDWFSNPIKARFTLDFAKAQFDSTTSSTKSIPTNFAYFDYYLFSALGIKNEMVLSAGLIKSYFGNAVDWTYPLPIRDATEQYPAVRPSASADFGAMLYGNLLTTEDNKEGIFKYYLEILNAEGFDKIFNESSVESDNLCIQFAGYLMPIMGVSIGGTYRNVNYNTSKQRQEAYAAIVAAKNIKFYDENFVITIPVDFLFQYVALTSVNLTNDVSTTGSVISATLGYGLFENTVTPYIRYDIVDENISQTNTSSKLYKYSWAYGGINIKPTKGLTIRTLYAQNLDSKEIMARLEMEYALSFTIKQ